MAVSIGTGGGPPPLVLASGSPRRQQLLAAAGLRFTVAPADVDETPPPGVAPVDLARTLAQRKAVRVAAGYPEAVVLGADTVVDLDGLLLGKPADAAEAIAMLRRLQGRSHAVHTGIALAWNSGAEVRSQVVSATVTMRAISRGAIIVYVATGEPLDKAGAYALQGLAGAWISSVEGSRTAVVGLPMDETLALLARVGIHPQPTPP